VSSLGSKGELIAAQHDVYAFRYGRLGRAPMTLATLANTSMLQSKSISGNIGSIPRVIFRLMYGPSNDRGASNNGYANAACWLPRRRLWRHPRLHRDGRRQRLR